MGQPGEYRYVEVPQRVMYERVGELELWEVTLVEEEFGSKL
jgi:hypothetical protein